MLVDVYDTILKTNNHRMLATDNYALYYDPHPHDWLRPVVYPVFRYHGGMYVLCDAIMSRDYYPEFMLKHGDKDLINMLLKNEKRSYRQHTWFEPDDRHHDAMNYMWGFNTYYVTEDGKRHIQWHRTDPLTDRGALGLIEYEELLIDLNENNEFDAVSSNDDGYNVILTVNRFKRDTVNALDDTSFHTEVLIVPITDQWTLNTYKI